MSLVILLASVCARQPAEDLTSQVSVDPNGEYSWVDRASSHHLFQASTWAPLDANARAELYVASAAVGLLGEDIRACARLMQPAEFQYGADLIVRGAAASADLPPEVLCTIGEGAFLSIATVQRILSRDSLNMDEQNMPLLKEIASLDGLSVTPANERALLAVLLMREGGRTASPLMSADHQASNPASCHTRQVSHRVAPVAHPIPTCVRSNLVCAGRTSKP